MTNKGKYLTGVKPGLAPLQTIKDLKPDEAKQYLEDFKYQPALTKSLDLREGDFNQDCINEIVLWKVNRYAPLHPETLAALNRISCNKRILDEKLTREVLNRLLSSERGIRLPMASTILRFKNPHIYQIIDQRVYRFIRGEDVIYPKKQEDQADFYLSYLKELRAECQKYSIEFKDADRILYQADKTKNKHRSIKY